jgi:hypothetical protein
MTFPSNPNNNDIHQAFGRRLRYKQATRTWEVVSSPITQTIAEALPTTAPVAQAADLPMTGNEIGSMAYVAESNRLYVWNGSGWFEVALVNTNPSISGGVQGTYAAVPNGDPIVVTIVASDPEGLPLTWSHTVTSGNIQDTSITNVDNVFTITPGATETSFNVTFTASDGVNTSTSTTTVAVVVPWYFQGTQYGWASGGVRADGTSSWMRQERQRWPFASEGGSTNLGSGTAIKMMGAASSSTYGWYLGGSSSPGIVTSTIEGWALADGAWTAGGANLSIARDRLAGVSAQHDGYAVGGYNPTYTARVNKEKFPFANMTPVTNAALGVLSRGSVGHSTSSYGFFSSGDDAGNVVYKFPFAVDADAATTVGTLGKILSGITGVSGSTHGYTAGGYSPTGTPNAVIYKFSFSSDADATSVGNLSAARFAAPGFSSTTHGHLAGGASSPYLAVSPTNVQKFPFASDGNATDVGYLVLGGGYGAGMQI